MIALVDSPFLCVTEDQEFEVKWIEKNANNGVRQPASGFTDITVHISETWGGSTIHADLVWTMFERGTTGIYFVIMDQPTLTARIPEVTYPDGTELYLVVTKPGDVNSRNWMKTVIRHRVGNG